MKTQTSRDSFRPAARISGVYLQQGRMILDADWNEATDVGKARLESALHDAIASGAPRTGGLAIEKPAGGVVIHPGVLYVDGIPARLDGPAAGLSPGAQPDYKHAPAFLGANARLYADVWERPFTALEDMATLDPGLHGADTATHTRTMLQVKWCDAGKDPMSPADNPPIGNAHLRLRLRKIVSERDCCDPCAAEVEVDERTGDYVFRLEVHEVLDDGSVVLKWSRDNGAEAYTPGTFPEGFDQGDWTWEFFDSDTENLLGHHFRAGGDPPMRRGVLQESFTVPAAPQPNAFVRQWDGYAVVNPAGGGALIKGRDRNAALSTTLDADAHARVSFDGDGAHFNLDLVELHLSLTGATFVPGDYWQATVREAIHASGDWILGEVDAEPPKGIFHHYLQLAQLDAAGNLVAQTDAQSRQMHFPPLTDIHAADVGFTSHCNNLFAGAENVQAALDALCGIDAGDIAYTMPQCPTDPSIKTLMAATLPNFPDLDGVDPKPSVKDILDAFLCHLDATRLPVVKANLCDDLKNNAGVISVQDALDALCKRPGGGCEVSVPVGKLQELLEAFAADPNRPDLNLCLLPGEHELTRDPLIKGKNSLRIHAASPEASIIVMKETQWTINAIDISFDRVQLRAEYGAALRLAGKRVGACGCVFRRHSGGISETPMVRIDSMSADTPPTVDWHDNVMFETWTKRTWLGDRLIRPDVIVHSKLIDAFRTVFEHDGTLATATDFDAAVNKVVDVIGGLTPQERKTLAGVLETEKATAIDRVPISAVTGTPRTARKAVAKKAAKRATKTARLAAGAAGAAVIRVPTEIVATRIDRVTEAMSNRFATNIVPVARYASIRDELEREAVISDKLKGALINDLVLLGYESGYNTALAFSTNEVDIHLDRNRIEGEVLLMNEVERGRATGIDADVVERVATSAKFEYGRGALCAHGNHIRRLWCLVPPRSVNGDQLVGASHGFWSVSLCGNTLGGGGNSLVSRTATLSGNHFADEYERDRTLIKLLSERFVASALSTGKSHGTAVAAKHNARTAGAAVASACHFQFGAFPP